MANLKDIKGKVTISLSFDESKLAKMFGYPNPEADVGDIDDGGVIITDKDLADMTALTLEEDGDEPGWYDYDDEMVPDEVVEEVRQAAYDAMSSGAAGKYRAAIEGVITQALEQFSSYPYEYWYQDVDSGTEESAKGTATGIEKVEFVNGTVAVTAADDLVHIINDCITGVCMFIVTSDLEGEDVERFAQTRFGQLAQYWSIYGDVKPQLGDVNLDDFDEKYFKELVNEIGQRHNFKLMV